MNISIKHASDYAKLIGPTVLNLPPDKTAQQIKQLINSLYHKEWSVRIPPPYEYGVLNYLSRYITGGPLKRDKKSRRMHEKSGCIIKVTEPDVVKACD